MEHLREAEAAANTTNTERDADPSYNAYKEAFELLLSAGADIDTKDKDGGTALTKAARRGDKEVVKLLLSKGAKVNCARKDGVTALYLASQEGHADVATMLLSERADVHTTIDDGRTALYAASQNGHADVAKMLLREGADVHATDNDGGTALIVAARNGHKEVVELLLSEGAKVNGVRKDGVTALFLASQEGHADVAEVLLSRGAFVRAETNDGWSALMGAAFNGCTEMVMLLLSNGAKVKGANKDGYTALHCASQNGHAGVAEVLLREGADVHATDNDGQTPHDVACRNGHMEVLVLLIEVHDAPLHVLMKGIRECERGPKAPSVGVPAMAQGGAPVVTLSKLLGLMRDFHYAMPRALSAVPMRLLLIDAVLGWPTLKMYEDINTGCLAAPAAAPMAAPECLDVPYVDVSEEQWARTLIVSWRWGAQKPTQLLRCFTPGESFTPMLEPQFRELRQVLRQAKGVGLQYVWIDWCCVPQYSAPSMVEVLRSKVFYIRARVMTVIPTFKQLPAGVVRLLLVRVRRVLEERHIVRYMLRTTAAAVLGSILDRDLVAGREYFSRVWTLAERMARHGRLEQLNQWLSLEAWIGMVVDAMLGSTEDRSASQVYRKILGQEAGALLDTIMGPLATAIEIGSIDENEGLQDMVARLFCAAVSIWQSGSNLEEAPTTAWLRSYLLEADLDVYQAWSEADRVWAVYSYFGWNQVDSLALALRGLVKVAGGDDQEQLFAVMAKKVGLE